MATSSFWDSGIGRWLGSTKNILGSVLAAGAVGGQLVFGLGAFWPLVVLASYGVGALVAPRERLDLRMSVGEGATAAELDRQLNALRRATRGEAKKLEDDANVILQRIFTALDEIVARWDDLRSAPDQRHVVERMIVDYLPTSVETFVNLPRTFALNSRIAGRRSAHDELVEQLTILEGESDRIRTAVYAREVDALSDQSRFLREKFGRSELEL